MARKGAGQGRLLVQGSMCSLHVDTVRLGLCGSACGGWPWPSWVWAGLVEAAPVIDMILHLMERGTKRARQRRRTFTILLCRHWINDRSTPLRPFVESPAAFAVDAALWKWAPHSALSGIRWPGQACSEEGTEPRSLGQKTGIE
jgi:hypothetical protein